MFLLNAFLFRPWKAVTWGHMPTSGACMHYCVFFPVPIFVLLFDLCYANQAQWKGQIQVSTLQSSKCGIFRPMNCPQQDTHPLHHCLVNLVWFGFVLLTSPYTCNWQNHSSPKYSILDTVFPRISIILKRPAHFLKQYGYKGRDPFNQNFREIRSKTQWIGSVQLEKFRKKWSTFWGGPIFPIGILVEWIVPKENQLFIATLFFTF